MLLLRCTRAPNRIPEVPQNWLLAVRLARLRVSRVIPYPLSLIPLSLSPSLFLASIHPGSHIHASKQSVGGRGRGRARPTDGPIRNLAEKLAESTKNREIEPTKKKERKKKERNDGLSVNELLNAPRMQLFIAFHMEGCFFVCWCGGSGIPRILLIPAKQF